MSIVERQEVSENIELLAAQKNIYSRAKNIIGFQMILSVPIAICAAITIIMKPEWKEYIVIWGILVILFDLFLFTPWVKRLQNNAAKIQELFDTKVLGLDWNEISVGKKPDAELIHEEALKHGLEEVNIGNLRKWYPTIIESVPEKFGIIISQRSNVWWDAKMRRKYIFFIQITLLLMTFGLISYGIYNKYTILELLVLFTPLVSTYVFSYRQMRNHSDAADRLDNLKSSSEKIWLDALAGKAIIKLKSNSRSLQDQIFEHRKKNPPIFDFLFRMFRDKNERLMNKGAESLVKDYLEKK